MVRVVGTVAVTPAVWDEVVEEGRRIGAPEVERVEAAAASGLLTRVDRTPQLRKAAEGIAITHRLGRGESEVLALAGLDGRCIVDEGRASRVASAMGLTPIPTLLIPVIGARSGVMTVREARALLRELAIAASARADLLLALEAELKGEAR
jgi:predicted nucleic acid-binding protein